MSRQIQFRRGTATEHENFIGAMGEITVDTTNKTLRVHDGETAGGTALARQSTLDATDYVVAWQTPTAENNYTWYRKYKSGWVEQGGTALTNGGNATTVTLPTQMSDTAYQILIQGVTSRDGYDAAGWQIMPVTTEKSPKTTTGFFVQSSITGYNLRFNWHVAGHAEV